MGPSPKRKFRFKLPRRQSTYTQRSKLPLAEPPPVPNSGRPETDSNATGEEEDDYVYHVSMVSDILTPRGSDQYWGVSIPAPRLDAADVLLSEETGYMEGASLESLVYMLTDPQPSRVPAGIDVESSSRGYSNVKLSATVNVRGVGQNGYSPRRPRKVISWKREFLQLFLTTMYP